MDPPGLAWAPAGARGWAGQPAQVTLLLQVALWGRSGAPHPGNDPCCCRNHPALGAGRSPDLRIAACWRPQLPAIGVGQEFISFKNTTMESDKYICVRETGAQNTVVIVDMANPMAPARRPITADSALMCTDKKVIALKATTPGVAGDTLQVFNLDTKQKLKTYQMPDSVEFWKWISPTSLGLVTAGSVYHWDIDVSAPALGSWGGGGACTRQRRNPGHHRVGRGLPGQRPGRWPPLGTAQLQQAAAGRACGAGGRPHRTPCGLQGAADAPTKIFDRTANLAGAQIISYRTSADGKWCVLVGIMPGAPER